MNKPKASLVSNPRIVPPDSLLKFGYSPSGGIEFDSTSALLNILYDGAAMAEIGPMGLAVRDGNGFVVGHSAQITAPSTAEFQVLGTGGEDSSVNVGRWSADSAPPAVTFVKSRDPAIFDGSYAVVSDGDDLGRITWFADDGTDLNTPAARILVEVDGTPGANDMPGRISFHTTPNGAASLAERMRIDNSGGVFVGETSNANMTRGLTINQGANDDEILALKSSDVDHGMTTRAETDTFGVFKKGSTTNGGLEINGWAESSTPGLEFNGANNVDNTSKDGTALAPLLFQAAKKSGTTSGAVGANGNLMVVRTGGGAKFIVDEDGELFASGGSASTDMVTLYDGEDDIALSRSFYHVMDKNGAKGLVRDRWDDWVKTGEDDLVEAGILGAPLSEGGLVNFTGLTRLNTGAIWQLNTNHMTLVERVDSLTLQLESATKQLAALAEPIN